MTTTPANEELTALRKKARRRLVGAITLVLISLIFLWNVLDSAPPPSIVNNQPVAIVSNSANLNVPVKPMTPITAAPTVVPSVPVIDSKPVPVVPADVPKIEPVKPAQPPVAQILPEEPKKQIKPETKPALVKPEKSAMPDPAKILAGEENHANEKKPLKKESKPDIPKTEKGVKPTDDAKGQGRFVVQIGAFADSAKAKALQAKLKASGLNVITELVDTPKGKLTRLRMAPFAKRGDAEKASAKVKAAGGSGAIVGK